MGIRIQNSAAQAQFLRGASRPLPELTRERTQESPLFARSQDDEQPGGPLFAKPEAPDRTGFGRGTVSNATSAVRVLQAGMDAADRVTPSLKEQRAAVRERLREQRAAATAREQERDARLQRLEASRANEARLNPVDNARSIINTVNQRAEQIQERVEGAPEQRPTSGASIQVNDEVVSLRDERDVPRIDVRI